MAKLFPMRLAVGIATAGRREALSLTLQVLGRQSRLPDLVVVCPAKREDFDESLVPSLPYPVEVVRGKVGLPNQRNAILDRTRGSADAIVFFDDDFYPASNFLAECENTFVTRPDVVGMTGHVIADGKLHSGISHEEALSLLESDEATPRGAAHVAQIYNLYGCNMAFRMAPIAAFDLAFDGRLPLYGWLEDVDFSRVIARRGVLIENDGLRGVHLAVKRGRTSGFNFGYSQVANPIYLLGKGTMALDKAIPLMVRNVARNLQRAVTPEPWVDRRGRLRGNALAVRDLLRGRLRPENILSA